MFPRLFGGLGGFGGFRSRLPFGMPQGFGNPFGFQSSPRLIEGGPSFFMPPSFGMQFPSAMGPMGFGSPFGGFGGFGGLGGFQPGLSPLLSQFGQFARPMPRPQPQFDFQSLLSPFTSQIEDLQRQLAELRGSSGEGSDIPLPPPQGRPAPIDPFREGVRPTEIFGPDGQIIGPAGSSEDLMMPPMVGGPVRDEAVPLDPPIMDAGGGFPGGAQSGMPVGGGMARTMDFQDTNLNGIDDRDEPNFSGPSQEYLDQLERTRLALNPGMPVGGAINDPRISVDASPLGPPMPVLQEPQPIDKPMPMPPVEVPPAPILNDPFRGPVEVPSIPGVQPGDLNPVLPEVINIDQVPFPVPDFSGREGPMGIVGPAPKRSPFMPLPPARTMPVPPAPIMPGKMPSPINQIIGDVKPIIGDVKPIRPRPPVSLPLPVQDLGPIGSMSGMPGMGRGPFGR